MNQNPLSGSHIFIIEDDPYMQHVLSYCLSKDYEVSVFNNGMAAMAALQGGTMPDLIVTDLNTPVLNGMDLLVQVKNSGFFSTIPVMIVSGDHASEKRIKCLSAGADDYVVKPFNPQELEIRVNIVLKRTRGTTFSLKLA